ncbi:MAG: hypothetical protein UY50_C0030G0008 [Parcubacteria group bacterium GW2011_GWA2_49_9]|nr:MAG: hypothetical protein UY50_C0030G0008 [Parcubacteria group bacterium GW2011_GWA2_49_9]
MKTKEYMYVGYNRPLTSSLHSFVVQLSNELGQKECIACFPKSSGTLSDALPQDGFWPAEELRRCGRAIFVFDQDSDNLDALAQLGAVATLRIPVQCILVQRSVCLSPIKGLVNAYGFPLFETWDTGGAQALVKQCLLQSCTA